VRIPDADAPCWLDGRRVVAAEAGLSLDDPAVQCGLGLFETIALRDGALLELDEHLDRLCAGIAALGLDAPPRAALRAHALAALDGAPACGWVKVLVSGAGRSIVYRGAMDPAEEGRPASAVLLPWRRNPADPLAGLKTLNYAANRLGTEEARRRGADEGLWLNVRGRLAEGCSSNLFVVRGRGLFTPALGEGVLPGVMRGLVLGEARALGIPTWEVRLRLERLERASEAFLTSSLRGVRPLVRFEGRPVGRGTPGPVTARLAAAVAARRRGLPAGGDPGGGA
jgi:branched-subunit amino acid aminotransferase/4-amino-4-deoxychorismate lyase